MKRFFQYQINSYDKFHLLWESPKASKIISNVVIISFLIGLLAALLSHFKLLPDGMKVNIFYSIELAFNVLLIFEAMSLIFLFPNSVADSVGKQFEIISLILLRDAFKEFGHYLGDLEWSMDFLVEMTPIISDAFGAILIFLITGLFYRAQKHFRITRNYEEQFGFIKIKKLLSIYLVVFFVIIGLNDLFRAYESHTFNSSVKLFYNLLIFTDLFILLFSLRYTTKYFNLFRYSSFALATIFLRLTLSAPAYYNVLLAVIAGLMVLLVTYIYNYLLTKPEPSKDLNTISQPE